MRARSSFTIQCLHTRRLKRQGLAQRAVRFLFTVPSVITESSLTLSPQDLRQDTGSTIATVPYLPTRKPQETTRPWRLEILGFDNSETQRLDRNQQNLTARERPSMTIEHSDIVHSGWTASGRRLRLHLRPEELH